MRKTHESRESFSRLAKNREKLLTKQQETMKYTITIVGIRKYLPNGEEDYPKLFSRLPVGSTVYLRKEPTGSEYPGSVSVLDDDCCKIGSVSKT